MEWVLLCQNKCQIWLHLDILCSKWERVVFWSDVGSSRFSWNVGTYIPSCMASHSRRLAWEPGSVSLFSAWAVGILIRGRGRDLSLVYLHLPWGPPRCPPVGTRAPSIDVKWPGCEAYHLQLELTLRMHGAIPQSPIHLHGVVLN
jgi:hypothetical protein